MKRGRVAAVAIFGVGIVFSVQSASRPALLAVGIACYVIGTVLLVLAKRSERNAGAAADETWRWQTDGEGRRTGEHATTSRES